MYNWRTFSATNEKKKLQHPWDRDKKIFDEICKEIFVPGHCLWDWYVLLLCDKYITGSFNLWWLNVREHSSLFSRILDHFGNIYRLLKFWWCNFYRHHHRWLVTPPAVADKTLQIFFIMGIIPSLFCTGQLYSFKTFEGERGANWGTVSTWEGEFFKLTPN